MKAIFKRVGTYSRGLCAIVLTAVIGFSFVTCSNGSTDSNAVIDPKWRGTYKAGDTSIVVAADTVIMPGGTWTVRYDKGIGNDGSHQYILKKSGIMFLHELYFFNNENPFYLKHGSNPNLSPKYVKQP